MEERGWGWTAAKIRQARFLEWLVPRSSSASYVSVKPFYDTQPGQDALTITVIHDELWDLDHRSLIDFVPGIGGIEGYDALATAQGRRLAEERQSRRADKRARKTACRDAMVDWLYAQDAVSPAIQPVRNEMIDDPHRGTWLAEPFTPGDLDAAAGWLYRQGMIEGTIPWGCDGPVRLFLTDAGVTCAEEFGADTTAYAAARHRLMPGSPAVNTVTINGPASGVNVGSHDITQHAGDAIQTATVDIAGLTRFAEAVVQALPVLSLAPGDQRDAQALTGEIIRTAAQQAPDHSRLATLGRSLRAILEGAAGNALAAGLLSLLHG